MSNVTGYQVQLVDDNYSIEKNCTDAENTEYLNTLYSFHENDSGYKVIKVSGASTSSYTLTGLKANNYWLGRVRAYKVVNGKTVYSSWTTVKYAKVIEDTSNYLTDAQKQWVVDNTLKKFSACAKKYYNNPTEYKLHESFKDNGTREVSYIKQSSIYII